MGVLRSFFTVSLLMTFGCGRTSPLFCGNPGDPLCPAGDVCLAERCTVQSQTPDAACLSVETRCSTGCTNLSVDRDNCGLCGVQCSSTQKCILGVCLAGVERGPL